MRARTTERRATIGPSMGLVIPSIALKAFFVAVGVAASWVQLQSLAWIIVGVVLAILSAALPRMMFGWILILLLGASALWQGPPDWRFAVLLVAAHLLHVLSTQLLVLPSRSRIQARALVPVARRFALVQAPTQLGAWLILWLAGGRSAEASIPAFGFVAALTLLVLVLLLVTPLLHEKLRLR